MVTWRGHVGCPLTGVPRTRPADHGTEAVSRQHETGFERQVNPLLGYPSPFARNDAEARRVPRQEGVYSL